MDTSKATPFESPTPWRFDFGDYVASDEMSVAMYDAGTAKRVIQAVNSYEPMLKALNKMATAWANVVELGLIQPQHVTTCNILHDECRAAIAIAEGK